ncbi:MAG: ATPase [Flavobacteriales bacterium]|nr:ATPase [Flavobacteriales bacterium]
MKFRNILLMIAASVFMAACSGMANPKTEKFKVYGNCGMCKKTMETALMEKGIQGNWDKNTKMMEVTYDSLKYTSQQVHEIIAQSGYDTEKATADDQTYNNLHECCKYERKGK